MAASEKLKQAARENGKKGGRPATSLITQGEREIREEARKIGRSALKNVVQFWVDVMNGDIPGANCGDKLRASENLADRMGMPRKTKVDATANDIPPKMIVPFSGKEVASEAKVVDEANENGAAQP